MIDISYGIDIAHYENMKNLLAIISDNNKYKVMIRIEKLLVEK